MIRPANYELLITHNSHARQLSSLLDIDYFISLYFPTANIVSRSGMER